MAIIIRHTPTGMTADQYDEVLGRLEAAGFGAPAGRIFHVCFGDPENLLVSDIWESREAFENFAKTLKPILAEVGVADGEIAFLEMHNSIAG